MKYRNIKYLKLLIIFLYMYSETRLKPIPDINWNPV